MVRDAEGRNFRGPQVDGRSGCCYIYLNWFAREPDNQSKLFRSGEVMLEGLDLALVGMAERRGVALTCTINLTNDLGRPTTVRLSMRQS